MHEPDGVARAASAADTLAQAKELYASAAYDEALAVLDRLQGAAMVSETTSIAEYRVFCLLALDRRVPDNVAELRAGTWNKKEYSKAKGLFGRTLGLLGYGNIGQEMARRAHAFGMPIVVWR